MIKRFTLSLFVTLFTFLTASSQGTGGSIKGKVLDEMSEGMPFVNVAIYQFGNIKGGATTNVAALADSSMLHHHPYTNHLLAHGLPRTSTKHTKKTLCLFT